MELWPDCFRESHLAEGGNRTVYSSQSRRHPQGRAGTCRESQNKSKHLWLQEKLKYDSPKDNVLRKRTAKKIHEASNCELHEFQQRTNKVQCQHCHSYIEAGFQVCPCGGQLNMSEEMLSSIRQTFKQLTADDNMTFQGTRGARHGAQSWQKLHFLAKEFMRKNGKKGIYTSILDRFQNGEVFHASQLQHNWTKECEYLDYNRTIDISHQALHHNWNDTLRCIIFRYDLKQMTRGPTKSRPDYHQTTRAIVNMNKEASQIQESKRRHKYREDLDPDKLDWLVWLSHNWKWHFAVNWISGLISTQRHHQKSAEAHASGNREAFTDDDRWKANWWTTSWWEKTRCKWNDEDWGFFFLVSGFRT